MQFIALPLLVVAFIIWNAVHVVREYERIVVFRLGRLWATKGPGIVIVLPIIDAAVRLDMRTVVMDVPPQDVITKDNVSVKVNAVVYFRVVHPELAVTEVENFLFATSQNAQTTLRSVCGEVDLDDLLGEREKVNGQVQEIIDFHTDPWGIKVVQVAIKHIDLPDEMRRAMARQAEAERERRAKVIAAEGEFQASQRLAEASAIMSREPIALQLRYLQTLAEIATENNSTTVFPLPLDFLRPFLATLEKRPASD